MSKPQRPKTGFKQKNLGDLQKVSFDEIEKYADLLYEEKYEEKITGARNILFLIREPENMFLILQDKSNLLDILSRTLRDEYKKNMELSIYLLTFFESFSYYNEFHQFLIQQSIGEICLSIIDWNFMKYEYRKDEMIRWSSSDSISKNEYQIAMDKFLFLVRKQDRILYMAFMILLHLAEDTKIEVKMVKKDIVGFLINNLGRQNINLLSVILLFLKKLSMFQVNKDSMIKGKILDKLMVVFEIQHPLIWAINIQLIFNLSFDHNFRMQIINKPEYFLKLCEHFKLPDFRSNILRTLYNLSLEEESKPLFYQSDSIYILFELIDKFPDKIIGPELAALTLNLMTYPQNAKKMAEDGRIKNLIERALKNSDFELIKIVKCIIKYSGDSDINDIYDNYVDSYFLKILNKKLESNEFLIEIIEILSYIDSEWGEKLTKFNLIPFFEKNLRDSNYDELLNVVIQFFGNVASNKDCASIIAKSKIIGILHSTLLKKTDNYSIVFGIIFALYQLMPWEDTKKIILQEDDLIQMIIKCAKSDNEQITFVCLRFLEIVQIYDKKWGDIIKRTKFKLFKNDIMNKVKAVRNQIKAMNMGMMDQQGNYYDNDDDLDDEGNIIIDDDDGAIKDDDDNLYSYQYYG